MNKTNSLFLQTERLQFREWMPQDVDLIWELDSDPDVMEFIRPPITEKQQAQEYYAKIIDYRAAHPLFGNWVAELKETGEAIGWFSLKHLDKSDEIETGYRLLKKFWGKGYATEGAKALIQYGFEKCKLEQIVGITHPDHIRSQQVLMKCGMQFEKMAFFYGTEVRYYVIRN